MQNRKMHTNIVTTTAWPTQKFKNAFVKTVNSVYSVVTHSFRVQVLSRMIIYLAVRKKKKKKKNIIQ